MSALSGVCSRVGSFDFLRQVRTKGSLNLLPNQMAATSDVTFCYFRDESASATYFCKQKADSEPEEESASSVEKEWIYYRRLRAGEEERCVRHKQVQPRAVLCMGQESCVVSTE